MFQLAKFQDNRAAWRELLRHAVAKLPSGMLPGAMILPAPSGNRFAGEISRLLAKKWNLPSAPVFHKNSEVQSKGLTEPERYMAVQKGVEFDTARFRQLATENYTHYIIVDDMFTTGATLNQCARALWEAGVAKEKIIVFSLYYAVRESGGTNSDPDQGDLR